jgi:hypothetical protein
MSRSRIDAEQHISAPRLRRYLYVTSSNLDAAMALYEWNIAISGAFFESIGALEVALRNAMHEQLSSWHFRGSRVNGSRLLPGHPVGPCLQHAFPSGTARVDVERRIAQIYELRNRIAHHEAIHQRDLEKDFDILIGLCEALHPRLGWWVGFPQPSQDGVG